MNAMECRENYWRDANFYKDQTGQAHFPTAPLGADEQTTLNPWSLKTMPKGQIKLKEVA